MEMYENDLETFETNESYDSATIERPEEKPITVGLSIPKGTPMAVRRMLASYIGTAKALQEFKNVILEIRGAVHQSDYVRREDGSIIEVEETDTETGEVIRSLKVGTRTNLKTDKGLLTSTSPVVAKWVQESLLPLFTEDGEMGDLIEPVRVRVENVKTKSGKNTYGFTFLDD